jgi:hypothetical protein
MPPTFNGGKNKLEIKMNDKNCSITLSNKKVP